MNVNLGGFSESKPAVDIFLKKFLEAYLEKCRDKLMLRSLEKTLDTFPEEFLQKFHGSISDFFKESVEQFLEVCCLFYLEYMEEGTPAGF